MIRTVYIAAVLGVMTFFFALALGISWGIILEKDSWVALVWPLTSAITGLTLGALSFGLGLLFYRTGRRKATVDIMGEVEEAIHEDGRERVGTTAAD